MQEIIYSGDLLEHECSKVPRPWGVHWLQSQRRAKADWRTQTLKTRVAAHYTLFFSIVSFVRASEVFSNNIYIFGAQVDEVRIDRVLCRREYVQALRLSNLRFLKSSNLSICSMVSTLHSWQMLNYVPHFLLLILNSAVKWRPSGYTLIRREHSLPLQFLRMYETLKS